MLQPRLDGNQIPPAFSRNKGIRKGVTVKESGALFFPRSPPLA